MTSASAFITKLLDPGGSAGEGTPRQYVSELPTSQIKLVPEENYRWGSREVMKLDLAHTDRDPVEGGVINTYEILKDSIRAMGVNEPSGVVMREDGFYHIVFGFTRIAAALECGISKVPVWVYDPELPDTEARLLQMMENSTALKRSVNWVSEVKTFRTLATSARMSFEAEKKVRLSATGKPLTPKDAAEEAVCRALGVSVNTMRTRLSTFEKVDQRVRDLAKSGKFSYATTAEFLPIKEKANMTAEIVSAVLDEMKRRDPEYKSSTPETVRQVYRWVVESRVALEAPDASDGEEADDTTAVGEPRALTACMEQNMHRMSAAAARDTGIEMLLASFIRQGLTLETPPESWEKVRLQLTWMQVVGIGIGTSEVLSPVIAGNSFVVHSHNYAIRVFLGAALRLMMPKWKDGEKFNEWISGLTSVRTGTQVMNRVEFARAIDLAVSESDHRTPLKAVLIKAADELKSRLFR